MCNIHSFEYGESGLTRFLPNVEQITVRHESGATWLIARRNDVEIRFPLNAADCKHLALLLCANAENTSPSV
jgi:hypothetical protein